MTIKLTVLTDDEKLAEIRRLYFVTTRQTILQDLDRALHLLKSMSTEDERERATVYMEGLAQMRKDWGKSSGESPGPRGANGKPRKPSP